MYIKVKNFKKNNIKKITGIIYGKDFVNKKIEFDKKNYYKILKKNDEIKLKLLNKNINVKIKDVKKHQYKNELVHVDFLFINEE